MLTLLAKNKRTHTRYITTHTKTTAHKLRQATRRLVLSFSALAIACMPLLSLPANAQSSITGLSTTSGPGVGGTEVTFEGEVKASFKQVVSGGYHSLALTNAGEVYAWGDNYKGQLGDGTTTNRSIPTLVTALSGQTVTALAAGEYHSLALTSSGQMYAWGDNYSGELGDGTTTDRSIPVLVTAISGETVTTVLAGYYHSLALTSTGAVYAWGANGSGQLGDGTTTNRTTPTLVTALSGQTVTALAGGGYHSLALTSTGAVYAWGDNYYGQLGDSTTTNRTTPTLVTALSGQTVTAVAAGSAHSLALTSTGAVYAWGYNGSGQIGDGTTTSRTTPTLVTALSGQTVTAVAAGDSHSLAITSTGAVYAWGANWAGQLGDGTTTDRTTPTLVTALSGQTVTAVAAGNYHSLAPTSTGEVYAWGWNWAGELGDGTTTDRTTPTLVDTTNVTVQTPTVTFGGLPATNVQIVDGLSGKELKATTPAHAPGVVDVVITFPGETPITLANAYTYLPTTTVELSGITHPDPNGIAPALASGSLLAAGACNNITEPSVALLSPTGASAPASVSLYGGVGFSLDCTSNGDAATVSIALSDTSDNAAESLPAITSTNLTNLRAYKSHSGTLTDITNQATFALGAGNTVLVSYQLVDGGELDEDGAANGTIVDPVYIGYYMGDASESGSLAETGSSTLLLATAGIVLVLGGAGGVYVVATTRRRTQFSR